MAKVKKWDNNNLIYGIISRIGEVVIIDEKTEDVVIIEEAIKFSLNPGLSALLFFDKWEWCELYPAYEYNSVNHAHGPCYVFKEGTHMLFNTNNTKYDNDFVGYKLKFGAQWGGKEEAKAKFRKGMVGHCKAIPVFITDGTEAKVNEKIYFFKNGKWQVKK